MHTILIADDDFISLEILKAMLGQYSLQVVSVSSGNQAVAAAAEYQPQLIILDYEMDDLTGAEVCERLRQQPQFSATPIVALTSHQSAEHMEKCRAAGMNQTLHKPVAPDGLQQLLAHYQLI